MSKNKCIYLSIFILYVLTDFVESQSDGVRETQIQNHPHMVSIRYQGSHSCSGSIMTIRTVLTAAHCLSDKDQSDFTVIAGSTYSTEEKFGKRLVVRSYIHPDYLKAPYDYDVAVILLNKPVILNYYTQPIDLVMFRPLDGESVTAVGWGFSIHASGSNVSLEETSVTVISNYHCQDYYDYKITDRMICAEGKDENACPGNTGGSLVINKRLLGLVSFSKSCGEKNPVGYVSVPDIKDWINDINKEISL